MTTDLDPIVGNWYEHLDKGQKFQVVDIDDGAGVIEIQYFDGDLDKMDKDEWLEAELQAIDQPEDWTGPLDEVEPDDSGYTESK
jgi:hypothetical protein